MPSEKLVFRLRDEADFLFVPMAFEKGNYDNNMRLSFPSKLTDYTLTGLPLSIWGPENCSAVRWAILHSPIAEVVCSENESALDSSLRRLSLVEHRLTLGANAQAVGDNLFSHASAVKTFYEFLRAVHHN